MTVWQSWVRQWYLSLGATAQVQFYGIYLFSLRGGQRAAAAATATATAAVEAAMHALLPHACMLCMCCAPCAPGWRSRATVGCYGRIPRSTGRRKRARAAAMPRLIASAICMCVSDAM